MKMSKEYSLYVDICLILDMDTCPNLECMTCKSNEFVAETIVGTETLEVESITDNGISDCSL